MNSRQRRRIGRICDKYGNGVPMTNKEKAIHAKISRQFNKRHKVNHPPQPDIGSK